MPSWNKLPKIGTPGIAGRFLILGMSVDSDNLTRKIIAATAATPISWYVMLEGRPIAETSANKGNQGRGVTQNDRQELEATVAVPLYAVAPFSVFSVMTQEMFVGRLYPGFLPPDPRIWGDNGAAKVGHAGVGPSIPLGILHQCNPVPIPIPIPLPSMD